MAIMRGIMMMTRMTISILHLMKQMVKLHSDMDGDNDAADDDEDVTGDDDEGHAGDDDSDDDNSDDSKHSPDDIDGEEWWTNICNDMNDNDEDDAGDDDSNHAPDDIDGEEREPTKDEASDNNSNRLRSFRLHTELANLLTNMFLLVLGVKKRYLKG